MSRGLSNDGLIDGQYTRISAASLSNRGRIYGDTVAIRAGELVNTAGAQGGAVIASRGSLDLGIGSLVNERHALIYSAADLRIGGALDAAGRAVGQALRLLNTGATIEAGGDARIAVTQLMNLNANYTSETVTQAPVGKLFVRPDGSSARYDMTDNWFCVNDRPRCGKEVALLENDSQHGFLMPSDAYPASRYGPPFDYAPWYTSKDGARGKEVPIAPIRVPQLTVCREVEVARSAAGRTIPARRCRGIALWSTTMPSTQRSGRYLALRRPRIRRRGGRRAIVDVTASAWPPRPSAARNTKPPSPPSRRPMRSWIVASARSTRTTPGACRIASRSTKSTSSLPRRAHSRPTLAESCRVAR